MNVFRIHTFSEKNDVARGGVKVAVNKARTHFAIDNIITANDMLWDAADQSIIGPKKRGRNGTIKSEKCSHADDVITALYQLDT